VVQQDPGQKGPVRKLGRGLSALLGTPVQIQAGVSAVPSVLRPSVQPQSISVPEAPVAPAAGPEPTLDESVGDAEPLLSLREIPVEQIVPNRRQPRTDFDQTALESLAASIKAAGLMQPIMVRPRDGGFELVAGERRWRAAKLIGLAVIPAIVRDIVDQAAAELALIENIQREDLNPMERAFALRRLSEEYSLTHQEIADKVGLDRASVTNLLRLSDLDRGTADLVRSGRLTQGHGKALLSVTDLGMRSQLAARAMAEEWSVRELERQVQIAVKGRVVPSTATPSAGDKELTARDANVADLERQLSEHLGTRVSIQLGRKKGSGRLTLDFYNLDQFDGLMQKMGFGGRGR
jgi:ParB family chromosome partitioning protein